MVYMPDLDCPDVCPCRNRLNCDIQVLSDILVENAILQVCPPLWINDGWIGAYLYIRMCQQNMFAYGFMSW